MAALTVPRTGLGGSISGTGLITTLIKSISPLDVTVPELEVTSLSDSGQEKVVPGDIRKVGKVTVEFYFTGAAVPISTQMIQTTTNYAGTTYTITYPSAGTIAGTGFVSKVSLPKAAKGEIMVGSYEITFDGQTAVAQTVA